MNTAAVITASVFLAVSLAILIYLFLGKSEFCKGKFRNFFRACCGVYVSGALLVFVFTLIMKGLPVAFVVISDVTVLFVFIFTTALIYFMTRKLVQMAENAGKANEESGNKENK